MICWGVAFLKTGVLIATEDDFLAVSFEAGLKIDQLLLGFCEPIALCGNLCKIHTFLRRAIAVGEVPLCQSHLSFYWVFNAIIIINRSDILPKHAIIELPMFTRPSFMHQIPSIFCESQQNVSLCRVEANFMILFFEVLVYLSVEKGWGGFHAIFY